ncbi:MAG: hypothetical protein Q9183_004725, partial [Haloplaca sp. 2 TL-2023]
ADPDEEIAAHTLADFVNYPNDSRTAVKSPAPRNHFRSGSISLPIPSGSASFATSSSAQQDASTRAMKSPRGSASTGGSYATPTAIPPPDGRKGSVASAVSSSSPDGFPASEAVASPSDGDSPTLGRFPIPPATKVKKGKARDSMLLNRYSHASEGSGRERKESTPTIDTQNTEKKAERGLVIPFLPKFLKLAGSPRQSVSIVSEPPRDSMEITEVDEIPRPTQNQEQVKSSFEADSSDEDTGESYDATAFIGGAKLAASQRPTLIERGNAASGTRVMSMQDILKEGGVEAVADHLQRSGTSPLADTNPGPSTLKAKRFLGESSLKQKRAGIVGMPAVHETTNGVPVSLDGAEKPVKGKPGWQMGLFDGLRSNPVKRAATAPSGKKVVLPLQIGEEQKNVRSSIVSTPYPLGYKGRRSGDGEEVARPGSNSNQGKRVVGKDEAASIMLVLYSRSTNTPVIRKLTIPDSKEEMMFDADEKKPPFRATRKTNIDDEKLFRLLKIEYLHMRGLVKGYLSARSVHGISLLGYHRLSQLAAREHRPARRKTFRVYDDIFTEQRLLDLWKHPGRGRAKNEWVEWIRTLPRCSEDLPSGEENVALELVEGWHVRKIAFVFSVVLVLSLLATLLWVFLGVEGGVILQNDASTGFPVALQMKNAGFLDAGTRVVGGMMLGILVLLLGLTGTGAWLLLSWLVM